MSGTIIHVGAAPASFSTFADFADGSTAVLRRSEISINDDGLHPELVIRPPEQPEHRWPLAGIRSVPDQAGKDRWVMALRDDPLARLSVTDPEAIRLLKARCPFLRKRPKPKGLGRIFAWSLAAAASVALIIFVLVPIMADQLATFLPPKGERALGDATFEQIRTALADTDFVKVEICTSDAGRDALQEMQTLLEKDVQLPYPLELHVLDHDLINAFALPGGRVVLFRGLLDAASGPDEVAAVLAHEIGHVVNRDPARGALRSAGSIGVLGLIFGDFAGGAAVLFMVERLIDANYSQAAEAAADHFAHQTLASAGISPDALADFFERLRSEADFGDNLARHFMAHPTLGERIEAARTAGSVLGTATRPALSPAGWQALRTICG